MPKKAPFKHVKEARLQGMDKAKLLLERAAVAEMPKTLAVFADECLQYIWQTWPAKTGRTLREIQVRASGNQVHLVCLIPYSVYIHLPGERGSALFTRFIPAIEKNIPALVRATTERIAIRGTDFQVRQCPPAQIELRKAETKLERQQVREVVKRKRKKMTDAERRARDAARKRAARAAE
jgi:hypothetical protein